jgi:uroporphyrinogen decarboxylase
VLCRLQFLNVIEGVRKRIPQAKIIVFAKGVGRYTAQFEGHAQVLGMDWQTDPYDVNAYLEAQTPVQGNLDPLVLVAGGAVLDEAIDHTLNGFKNRPHIFNLGHGIVPQTPIAHVERLIERVKAFKG